MSQALSSAAPENADLEDLDIWAQYWLGNVLIGLDRMEEAKQHTQAALDRFRRLLARDPAAAAYEYNVGVTESQMARILLREGQPARAIQLLQDAAAKLVSKPSERSADIDTQEKWARTQSLLGDAYMALAGAAHHTAAESQEARRTACARYHDAFSMDRQLSGRSADAAQQLRFLTEQIHVCESDTPQALGDHTSTDH